MSTCPCVESFVISLFFFNKALGRAIDNSPMTSSELEMACTQQVLTFDMDVMPGSDSQSSARFVRALVLAGAVSCHSTGGLTVVMVV